MLTACKSYTSTASQSGAATDTKRYFSWFVIGQLCGNLALNRLNASDPFDFRTPIYTQWAMVGVMLIIFLLIPETPWWLASKGKLDSASKVLLRYNGHIEGYNVNEVIVCLSVLSLVC